MKRWAPLVMSLSLFGMAAFAVGAAPQPAPLYTAHILYLAATGLPTQEQLNKYSLPGQMIDVVPSFTDLKNRNDASVRAIILHRSKLAEVDPAWIKQQFQSSKVIVGIDITMPELEGLIGTLPLPPGAPTPTSNPAWVTYDGTRSIYSAMSQASGSIPGKWSMAGNESDFLYTPKIPLNFITKHIAAADHPEVRFTPKP